MNPFCNTSKHPLTFRPLTPADLPRMHRWLNTPFVQQWYGKRAWPPDEVAAKYLPRIEGVKPTSCFLILYQGEPIGHIQTYLIRDYPDYAEQIQVDEYAAGVDIFLGSETYAHRGLGTAALTIFIRDYVFSSADNSSIIMGPDPANIAAIRAYEKVGFRHIKTVRMDDGTEEYLMQVSRETSRLPG